MKNKLIIFSGIAALLIIVSVGLYLWILGPTKEASSPIQATPVILNTNTPSKDATEITPTTQPIIQSTEALNPTPLPTNTTIASSSSTGSQIVYTISGEESEAKFNIFEELGGQPKDVIGTTKEVAGEVAIDLTDLSSIVFGPIQINARTFVTDSNNRNNAIKNRILNTNEFEFITFTPTNVQGLSGNAISNQPYSFTITGDLTIRDVTQPVVFEVTVQAGNESRITGLATATISRGDYNLNVPSVPNVANVADEVKLEFEFVLIPK